MFHSESKLREFYPKYLKHGMYVTRRENTHKLIVRGMSKGGKNMSLNLVDDKYASLEIANDICDHFQHNAPRSHHEVRMTVRRFREAHEMVGKNHNIFAFEQTTTENNASTEADFDILKSIDMIKADPVFTLLGPEKYFETMKGLWERLNDR